MINSRRAGFVHKKYKEHWMLTISRLDDILEIEICPNHTNPDEDEAFVSIKSPSFVNGIYAGGPLSAARLILGKHTKQMNQEFPYNVNFFCMWFQRYKDSRYIKYV